MSGYGKPPENHRFKSGASGNPKGRPKKKAPSLADEISKQLEEKIPVVINGKKRNITMREAITRQLIKAGLKGDLKVTQMLLQHSKATEKYREEHGSRHDFFMKLEFQYIAEIEAKIGRKIAPDESPEVALYIYEEAQKNKK